MPSGFTPVVIDLRPSVKVMIPGGKPVPRNGNPKRELTLQVGMLRYAARQSEHYFPPLPLFCVCGAIVCAAGALTPVNVPRRGVGIVFTIAR